MENEIKMATSSIKHEPNSTVKVKYHVQQMEKSHIEQILELWRIIGLFEGIHTIETFAKIDPQGFIVAINDEDGSVIGSCAGVIVDPSAFAFVGLYAVRPQFQGQGIGINMWREMMKHIGGINAGLYALPEHLVTYRDKAGFAVEDEIRMMEFSGQCTTDDLVHKIDNIELIMITKENMQRAIDYDKKFFQYDRRKLLELTFTELDSVSVMACDKDNNNIVGFASIRANNLNRAMIGPLFADNDGVAEFLVYRLIEIFTPISKFGVTCLIATCNNGSIRIVTKLGLEKLGEYPRFWTKSPPVADFPRGMGKSIDEAN